MVWLTVEPRVIIRMEPQGQQEFGKFGMEGDPGGGKQVVFHEKQHNTNIGGVRTRFFLWAGK